VSGLYDFFYDSSDPALAVTNNVEKTMPTKMPTHNPVKKKIILLTANITIDVGIFPYTFSYILKVR